jgi:gluconokinase
MRRDSQPQRAWSAALAHTITKPVIAVVMGVSGSGKTTVSALLSAALGCQFQEGDDLHPAENVEKMHGGTPLTDGDRMPWLHKIAEEIDGWRARGESGVLTCSALKRSYRDIIIGGRPDVTLVYLKGSYDLIRRRMAVGGRPAEIAAEIVHQLEERQGSGHCDEPASRARRPRKPR